MNRTGKPHCGAIAMGGLVLTFASAVSAATWRVDGSLATNGDGTSWPNAFNNLTSALTNPSLAVGDSIWVADGIYKPVNQASSFTLRNGVRVLGGFIGSIAGSGGETNETQRNLNPATNGCILSGDLGDNDGPNFTNYGDNCENVVRGANLSSTDPVFTDLDAFTVKGGNAPTIPGGGGIQIISSSGDVRILRCRIIDNLADDEGGGIKLGAVDAAEIRWCEITHNACGGFGGGGIDVKGSNFDLVATQVTNNTATGGGGGVFTDGGTSNIFNCVVMGNSSSASAGGGIYASGTTSTLLRIVNTLVAENTAPTTAGGGLYTNAAEIEIINSTFAANAAGTYGGGVYFLSASNGIIDNSIVWGNSASAGNPQIALNGNPVTVTFSDVQQPTGVIWPGANNINLDPLFVSPANENYRLSCASPCLNFGDNNRIAADSADLNLNGNLTEDVPWDLDTRDRIEFIIVDMGAYENTIDTACPANIHTVPPGADSVNIDDLLMLIGMWGPCPVGPPGPVSCAGDIASTSGCGGDGVVDINDLLAVIGAWGPCGGTPETFPGGLNDCFNVYCAGLSGDAWEECLEKCFDAYCEARPQECD